MSIAPHTALGAILPILYGRVAQYDKLIGATGAGRYAWGSQQLFGGHWHQPTHLLALKRYEMRFSASNSELVPDETTR